MHRARVLVLSLLAGLSHGPAGTLCISFIIPLMISQSAAGQCEIRQIWQFIPPGAEEDDRIGGYVTLHPRFAVVCADGVEHSETHLDGSVYLLPMKESATYTEIIAPENSFDGERFGKSAAINSNFLVVGSPEVDGLYRLTGVFDTFHLDQGAWKHDGSAYSMSERNAEFGHVVALRNDVVVIGDPHDGYHYSQRQGAGAVYIFRRRTTRVPQDGWVEEARYVGSSGDGANFGWDVAIDGSALIIGSPGYKQDAIRIGAVAIYREIRVGQWNREAFVIATDHSENAQFGSAVAIDGDVALIGANHDNERGLAAGAAYVYRFNGSDWVEEAKLFSESTSRGDFFGSTVALKDGIAVVGAPSDNEFGLAAGSVTVFRYEGGAWIEESTFNSNEGDEGDQFGSALAFDGHRLLVGAPRYDENDALTGAAFMFTIECR